MRVKQLFRKDRNFAVLALLFVIVLGSIIIIFTGIFISNTFFSTELPVNWRLVFQINTILAIALFFPIIQRLRKLNKILNHGMVGEGVIEKLKIMTYDTEIWKNVEMVTNNEFLGDDKIRFYIRIPFEDGTTVISTTYMVKYLKQQFSFSVNDTVKIVYDDYIPEEFFFAELWFESARY